jgi:hypothetical protein
MPSNAAGTEPVPRPIDLMDDLLLCRAERINNGQNVHRLNNLLSRYLLAKGWPKRTLAPTISRYCSVRAAP